MAPGVYVPVENTNKHSPTFEEVMSSKLSKGYSREQVEKHAKIALKDVEQLKYQGIGTATLIELHLAPD